MSEEEKTGGEIPNPMKIFGDMFNQTVKQAGEQWEETARNPLFLAAMANQAEQVMQAQQQMKEMFSSSLKTLDLPTKTDFLLLAERIDNLTRAVADLDRKISENAGTRKKTRK
jgi:polyhydroxyalkanoate synthesis regulator phasin